MQKYDLRAGCIVRIWAYKIYQMICKYILGEAWSVMKNTMVSPSHLLGCAGDISSEIYKDICSAAQVGRLV